MKTIVGWLLVCCICVPMHGAFVVRAHAAEPSPLLANLGGTSVLSDDDMQAIRGGKKTTTNKNPSTKSQLYVDRNLTGVYATVTPPKSSSGTRTDMGGFSLPSKASQGKTSLSYVSQAKKSSSNCVPDPGLMREYAKLASNAQGGLGILFIAPLAAKGRQIDAQLNACRKSGR